MRTLNPTPTKGFNPKGYLDFKSESIGYGFRVVAGLSPSGREL